VAAAAVLWSTGGLVIKLVSLDALQISFWRSAVAALFLSLFLRRDDVRLTSPLLLTAVTYAGVVTLFVMAMKLTTSANVIFLQYSAPAYVLILSPLLVGERAILRDLLTIAACLLGVSLFFVGDLRPGDWLGNLLAVGSGIAFALLTVLLRRHRALGTLGMVWAGNVVAAVVALGIVGPRLAVSPGDLLGVVYLGVVQLGLSYVAFVQGMKRLPAIEASILMMIEPVLNPVWVFLGIGEVPSAYAILGGIVVLGSVTAHTLLQGARGIREPAPKELASR